MITAQIHLSTSVSAVARLPMVTVISERIIKKGRAVFVFCSGTDIVYLLTGEYIMILSIKSPLIESMLNKYMYYEVLLSSKKKRIVTSVLKHFYQ